MFVDKATIQKQLDQRALANKVEKLRFSKKAHDQFEPNKSDEKFFKYLHKPPPEPKPEKPIKMLPFIRDRIQVQALLDEQQTKKIETVMSNKDIKELNDGLFAVLSLPVMDEVKREQFKDKLKDSDTINDFVDQNILLNMVNNLSLTQRALIIWTKSYVEVAGIPNFDYPKVQQLPPVLETVK